MITIYRVRTKKKQVWEGIATDVENAITLARDVFLCPRDAILGVSIAKRIK